MGTFSEIKRDKTSGKVEATINVGTDHGLTKGQVVTLTAAPMSLTIRSVNDKGDVDLTGNEPGTVTL